MESAREIPGYYYDKEKKKYFKIQASSTAPAWSAYSSQDVKRRKLRDEKSTATALGMARQRGRIRRSKALENPLIGGVLAREHGKEGDGLDAARIFASGLVEQGWLPTIPYFSSCIFDDQLCTIRANTDIHTRSTSHGGIEMCNDSSVPSIISNTNWRVDRFGHPGTSTSLSVHESNRRLAMTWLAGVPHSGIAITSMIDESANGDPEGPNILLGPGLTRGVDVSIYSSTPAPPESSILFAFGSSHGIMTVDKRDFNTSFISPKPVLHEKHPKDIFALEFLCDNHSILLSGGRNGILNISDLRVPEFGAEADIIKHPSSITHIKQLDTHRIIVAGLNSSLCHYDLRFRKAITTEASHSRQRLKAINNLTPTNPILQYPEFHNTASIHIGFDIDMETGVVAAAQEHDEHHAMVQLFSLHGGHVLNSAVSGYTGMDNCQVVRCVVFARDMESKMKSLYMAPHDIQRYSWVSEGDAAAF